MAWFVTDRIRFLHVPKTGGSWATEAICAAGVPAVTPHGAAHATLDETAAYDDRFTIAFIRHPLDYWRSYWAFRMRTGWRSDHEIDRNAGCEHFPEFIERIIALYPGAASGLYEQFVGVEGEEIDFVGRYERLADDVCTALRIAGERFDERALRAVAPVNVSITESRWPLLDRGLAERLAAAEFVGIGRFYPWDPVPERLVRGGDPAPVHGELARRLHAETLARRDDRAQLRLTRSALVQTREQLRETVETLSALQNSRLQRSTRTLRRHWYRHRGRLRNARPARTASRGSGARRELARPALLSRSRARLPSGDDC